MHNKQFTETHLISKAALWDFIFHSALEPMKPYLSAVCPEKRETRRSNSFRLGGRGREREREKTKKAKEREYNTSLQQTDWQTGSQVLGRLGTELRSGPVVETDQSLNSPNTCVLSPSDRAFHPASFIEPSTR